MSVKMYNTRTKKTPKVDGDQLGITNIPTTSAGIPAHENSSTSKETIKDAPKSVSERLLSENSDDEELNELVDDIDRALTDKISLNFLSHMITPFNGDPKELTNFLQNANNAIGLATRAQRPALEMFIFSKISSEVKTKINMCDILTYTELRQKLKAVYSPIESYDYLMEQLETLKQRVQESIKEYYVRLDKICSKCLMATEKEADSHTLESEKRVIQRIALRRFTHHCIPELSQILRHKTFFNINEAFSLACEEEAYLLNEGRLKKHNSSQSFSNNKYCRNCKNKTHDTKDCRNQNRNSSYQNNNRTSYPNNSGNNNYNSYQSRQNNYSNHTGGNSNNNNSGNRPYRNNYNYRAYSNKYCNYCNYRGHEEIECRRKSNQNNSFPNPRIAQATNNYQRSNEGHLNYRRSQVPADTVDQLTNAVSSYSME